MARTRRSRQEWRNLVEDWRSSGQGTRDFCLERGLNRSTFGWWRWALGKQQGEAPEVPVPAPDGEWLELRRLGAELEEPIVERPPLTLVLGEGISIQVPVGFDGPTLERLIRTLGVIEC